MTEITPEIYILLEDDHDANLRGNSHPTVTLAKLTNYQISGPDIEPQTISFEHGRHYRLILKKSISVRIGKFEYSACEVIGKLFLDQQKSGYSVGINKAHIICDETQESIPLLENLSIPLELVDSLILDEEEKPDKQTRRVYPAWHQQRRS